MIVGMCLANGSGDLKEKSGSGFYRITVDQAMSMDLIDKPYMLLMNGQDVNKTIEQLKFKPKYVLLSNEQNELTWQIVNKYPPSVPEVLKGPFTCCVERAGQKAYKEMSGWNYPKTEVLNYYEVSSWVAFSWFKNIKRRYRFKKLIKKLRLLGVETIIVSEFHAGSKTRPGFKEMHGDYLYHNRKDYRSIVSFLRSCGVDIACYYMAPFIGRDGNDIVTL